MGQRASYIRPKQTDGAELIIHGTVYDITTFKHPGGSIIMNQVNPSDAGFPADATIAFETMHGWSKNPMKELARLRADGKSRKISDKEAGLMKEKRPYDQILNDKYHNITQRFREAGIFNYTLSHFLLRNAQILALLVWGAWCTVEPGEYLGYWHGCVMIGLSMQQAGWLQHELNHGSTSCNHRFNIIAGTFWFGMGLAGSSQWWRRSHNRHHCDPQRHGSDVDMDTLPIATDSLTARAGNRRILSVQHWFYQLAVWGLIHFWQLWLHPKNIVKNVAKLDALFLCMHWSLWFLFFAPRIGYMGALILHIVASSIEGSLLFTHFALSHTPIPFLPFHLREHWVERAFRRTVDIHSHSKAIGPFFGPIVDYIVDHFMGYLNYQVIHHLWPRMPHHHQMSPLVLRGAQELCEVAPELDLHYNVTTYWRAMYDMYSNLYRIARDHGLKGDFGPIHPQQPDWVRGRYDTTTARNQEAAG